MSDDVRPSRTRYWLRRLEFAFALLVLVALLLIVVSISPILEEIALAIAFFFPGLLGVVALVNAARDGYLFTRKQTGPIPSDSQWLVLGRLIVTGISGLLAIATLFIIVQTILIVTVIDTGGGVVFGPLLWMVTGSSLAVVVVFRSVVESLLVDERSVFPERSTQ